MLVRVDVSPIQVDHYGKDQFSTCIPTLISVNFARYEIVRAKFGKGWCVSRTGEQPWNNSVLYYEIPQAKFGKGLHVSRTDGNTGVRIFEFDCIIYICTSYVIADEKSRVDKVRLKHVLRTTRLNDNVANELRYYDDTFGNEAMYFNQALFQTTLRKHNNEHLSSLRTDYRRCEK